MSDIMTEAEAMALLTLGAALLPALSSRGWWIIALAAAAVGLMAFGFIVCIEESEGLAGIGCVFALIAGGVLGVASLILGLVRWRYRRQGAETAFGKPWVAGLLVYGLAILVSAGFMILLGAM